MTADWTCDGTRSNSSREYHMLAATVERLIVESARDLIRGNADGVARLIISQLAHVYEMSPRQPRRHKDLEVVVTQLRLGGWYDKERTFTQAAEELLHASEGDEDLAKQVAFELISSPHTLSKVVRELKRIW